MNINNPARVGQDQFRRNLPEKSGQDDKTHPVGGKIAEVMVSAEKFLPFYHQDRYSGLSRDIQNARTGFITADQAYADVKGTGAVTGVVKITDNRPGIASLPGCKDGN